MIITLTDEKQSMLQCYGLRLCLRELKAKIGVFLEYQIY